MHHDYAIAGWALSVSQVVRDHVSQNMLPEHREAIEILVHCLYVVPDLSRLPVGRKIIVDKRSRRFPDNWKLNLMSYFY